MHFMFLPTQNKKQIRQPSLLNQESSENLPIKQIVSTHQHTIGTAGRQLSVNTILVREIIASIQFQI